MCKPNSLKFAQVIIIYYSTKEEPTSNPPSPVKSHSPDSVIVHPSATNGKIIFIRNH